MSDKHLHIVAFSIPYPPNYGGVIDVFYKLKALHNAKVKIHLHCFQYERHVAPELGEFCETVHYYPRKTGFLSQLSTKPYIVKSRQSDELLKNLLADDYPILFEGLHSCNYLDNLALQGRKLIYRESNIEHQYYYNLAKSEQNLFRKLFFFIESARLYFYQKKLRFATIMLVVSQADCEYLAQRFPENKVVYLPSFHGNRRINSKLGKGDYVLYHGNLSVSENAQAAEFLVREVFNDLPVTLKIAGMNPGLDLRNLSEIAPNIELIPNPSAQEMDMLIANAQVNILITFQATGLKLKLLNTLFNGRWVLVNPEMLAGTGLDELCSVATNAAEIKSKILELFETEYDISQSFERAEILHSRFSDEVNSKKLIEKIWGKA